MVRILLKLIKRVRRSFYWIWKQQGTPGERARGIAVGIFSGCFPFFGFQSLIGIFLASLFKGNHLLAIVGTWISNPLTYLPLYWLNYKVGQLFFREENQSFDLSELTQSQMWDQGWIMTIRILLGSSVVGFIAAIVIGCTVYLLLKE